MSTNPSSRIRLIPPLVFGLAVLLGLSLEWLFPIVGLAWKWRIGFSVPLLIGSVWLIIWTLLQFRKADTPFDVRKEATSLITSGPFRFTRNPGYVALTLLYLSIGIMLSNLWILALLIPTLAIVDIAIVRREEINLLATFETHYQNYQHQVRRWI